MKFVLVFVSPNGTTKITSQMLKEIIIKDGHEVKIINIGINTYRENHKLIFDILEEADIVGFGSPACHMDVLEPMQEILRKIVSNKPEYDYNFKAFVYLNYAGITSGKAFINSVKMVRKIKIPVIGGLKLLAPHFHHNDKFPTEKSKTVIARFYNKLKTNNFEEIKWGRAKKLFAPEKLLVNILYPFVSTIGKKRELPISINYDKCKKCKKCVKECPVGAIDISDIVSINFDKCIHCYHCVVSCSFSAIESPIEKIDEMIKINKKIIGTEKPANNIYI